MSVMMSKMRVVRGRQRGFTLIEILVTVVVLAIGLLGLAGLQATSVRFNHSAYLRSQATSLAYDIADRMRANTVAARAGAYDGAVATNCAAVALAGTLAQQDRQAWGNALACTLPLGAGNICRGTLAVDGTCTAVANVFTIRVQWDDSRGQDPVQQFDMMTDL